jgi:hypothetical protein
MGGQGAGIIGWKGGSLGLRSPGEVEEVASVLAEALNRQNSTVRLHSEALACMLSVGGKLKTEIPVDTTRSDRWRAIARRLL